MLHYWFSVNARSVNVRRGIQATQGLLWVYFCFELRVKSGSPSDDSSALKTLGYFVLLKSSCVQIAAKTETLFLSFIPKGIHSVLRNKLESLLNWIEGRFGLKWRRSSHEGYFSITSDATIEARVSQYWSENLEKELIQILSALDKALPYFHLETSDLSRN